MAKVIEFNPSRVPYGDPEVPYVVIVAIQTRYEAQDAERILRELKYSSLNRCWFFTYAGMVHGVEPDGYIHT